MPSIRLVTPPAAEPITLAEVKEDLRIDHDDDDARLDRHIKEARQTIDGPKTWFARTLMTQTWEWSLDGFPVAEIQFPTAPVQSIDSIVYDDADGFATTLDADLYYLDNASEIPWLIPVAPGWTMTPIAAVNSVRVTFTAGYESAAHVPGGIKAALRLLVRSAYDGVDTRQPVHDLLTQYRLFMA